MRDFNVKIEAGELITDNPVSLMSCPGDRRMDQYKI